MTDDIGMMLSADLGHVINDAILAYAHKYPSLTNHSVAAALVTLCVEHMRKGMTRASFLIYLGEAWDALVADAEREASLESAPRADGPIGRPLR